MKYIPNRLLNLAVGILGGIFLMTTLVACNSDSIPENRTKEEYTVENSMQPVFDFLEEDPKDFSKVNSYSSRLSVVDNATGNRAAVYTLSLDNKDNIVSGKYTVTKNEIETSYPVMYSDGTLQFQGEKPKEDLLEILFQTVPESEFRKLDVADVMAEHPETEMKDISYQIDVEHLLFVSLIEKLKIESSQSVALTLSSHGDDIYQLQWSLDTEKYYFVATSSLKTVGGE